MSKTQNRHETEQACSPQNWTSVFTNRNSVRIPPLFTHIELKVSSGSVLTTRASPVFKPSTSSWRFSRATFPNRTEWVFISRANPVFELKHKSNLFAVELNVCSSIKLACSRSLWLYSSYRTESSTEQRYIAKLLIFNNYSGNWRTILLDCVTNESSLAFQGVSCYPPVKES